MTTLIQTGRIAISHRNPTMDLPAEQLLEYSLCLYTLQLTNIKILNMQECSLRIKKVQCKIKDPDNC